jgi:phage tail sheath gpL-like
VNRKVVGGQKPFTMLVANLRGGSDPSRGAAFNPVKLRTAFTVQHFVEVGGRGETTFPLSRSTPGTATRVGLATYTVADTPVRGTGTITVANNTFLGVTTVTVGKYEFVLGSDFAIGAGVNNTATNLAAAIDATPEYTASAVGATVTVTGLTGPLGNEVAFCAGGASPNNFTFAPTDRMSGAEPYIGPVLIVP